MKQPDRLKKRSQFLLVARKGSKIVTPGLIAQILPRAAGSRLYVGFTVTRKIGNSVIRNRVRRRLREAVRLVVREDYGPQEPRSSLLDGCVVFIGRQTTCGRDFLALKDDVRCALSALLHENGKRAERGSVISGQQQVV